MTTRKIYYGSIIALLLCLALLVFLKFQVAEVDEVPPSPTPLAELIVYIEPEPTPTYEGFDPDTDYMAIMAECCKTGDYLTGRKASEARNKKIATIGLNLEQWDFDELMELAKVITNEAGSSWLPMEWKIRVGEVVLNRVAGPEFPNTVYEVVHDKGQYANASTQWFRNLIPYDDCIEAAVRLMNGERLLNDISVVYQSTNKNLGSGIADTLKDPTGYYGDTYLCYTYHPELYKGE